MPKYLQDAIQTELHCWTEPTLRVQVFKLPGDMGKRTQAVTSHFRSHIVTIKVQLDTRMRHEEDKKIRKIMKHFTRNSRVLKADQR